MATETKKRERRPNGYRDKEQADELAKLKGERERLRMHCELSISILTDMLGPIVESPEAGIQPIPQHLNGQIAALRAVLKMLEGE